MGTYVSLFQQRTGEKKLRKKNRAGKRKETVLGDHPMSEGLSVLSRSDGGGFLFKNCVEVHEKPLYTSATPPA